ncbi:hypothetical protein [Candidatus Contubernalis alkaliaceticus]|uniref:hypothetical protein n=1 Tax=Candidatus Contubernalis alkaliaceticus TaxID=338645 RepID=UPI001F4BE9DB|nr:hypothetical protein [Candidatus Contubernalis alkalaceticus]UNC90759.1 hypothetical protein HUE98_00860 [Candidatus Contubernalis alkalaceticus]
MNEEALLLSFLLGLGAFLFVFAVIGLICYVLLAMGLYTMANNKGLENPWFAWVPILQFYILGQIIEEMRFGNFEVPNVPVALVVAAVAPAILGTIPLIGWLISLASMVILLYSLYLLFDKYSDNAVLKTVLSVVLPFLGPIFVFMMRNESPNSTIDSINV